MRFVLTVFLMASTLLHADAWKGDEYAKNSDSQKASADDFLQGVRFKGNESVLDVGCGDGKITAAMARSLSQGSVIGVDISGSMIAHAAKTFAENKNLTFQVQDASKLTFQNQFDLITSFTVMHWVIDQMQALIGFEKALKPGGRICIQMPTALPAQMQQALSKLISQEKWAPYFVDFSPPWRFYQKEQYRGILLAAKLTPTRLEHVPKHEYFPSRAVFQNFLKQWFPYLRPLPEEQKDLFLKELVDSYLQLLPVDEKGRVSFIVDRLEVEAKKV